MMNAAAPLPKDSAELPEICGSEDLLDAARPTEAPPTPGDAGIAWDSVRSVFAIALHMHQPLIPAGGDDLATARIISNLQYMMEHLSSGDNHNAPVFHWCYKRMGEFIPELVQAGRQPRIMLDYSGCLLHGLRQMGRDDVFEKLKLITCDPRYRHCVEWLGSAWGHAVAPSTPVQDFRLHVQAWRHHFAAIFGAEALSRVRGFSPCEMALPNHPEVCYEFLCTLRDCGYRWLLVQEHTVETPAEGRPSEQPYLPHRLVARDSRGRTISMIAIIKTQGSDTKLVGQMQPYYEAKNLGPIVSGDHAVPPLVTQIADGENGGVMMNEFPPKYRQVMEEASGSTTPAVNVSEYLAYLGTLGIRDADFPVLQPALQHRIWERFPDGAGPEAMEDLITKLRQEDARFNMEGGSWTNNISWVRGYENVLGPMQTASAWFARKVLAPHVSTAEPRYRNALFHLLLTQTSCFRYWGQGRWTDYGHELCRRTMEILRHDF